MNQKAAQAMQSLNHIYKCADERTGEGIDGQWHRTLTAHYELVGQFLSEQLHIEGSPAKLSPVPDPPGEEKADGAQ